MGFFGRSTAGDIPGRPRDPSCSRADVRLQLLVFSGRVVRDIGVCGGFVSTEDETSDQQTPRRTAIRTIATETPIAVFPALFYVGDGPDRFERAFARIGVVWVVPKD